MQRALCKNWQGASGLKGHVALDAAAVTETPTLMWAASGTAGSHCHNMERSVGRYKEGQAARPAFDQHISFI
jgi:hypothetical protein